MGVLAPKPMALFWSMLPGSSACTSKGTQELFSQVKISIAGYSPAITDQPWGVGDIDWTHIPDINGDFILDNDVDAIIAAYVSPKPIFMCTYNFPDQGTATSKTDTPPINYTFSVAMQVMIWGLPSWWPAGPSIALPPANSWTQVVGRWRPPAVKNAIGLCISLGISTSNFSPSRYYDAMGSDRGSRQSLLEMGAEPLNAKTQLGVALPAIHHPSTSQSFYYGPNFYGDFGVSGSLTIKLLRG